MGLVILLPIVAVILIISIGKDIAKRFPIFCGVSLGIGVIFGMIYFLVIGVKLVAAQLVSDPFVLLPCFMFLIPPAFVLYLLEVRPFLNKIRIEKIRHIEKERIPYAEKERMCQEIEARLYRELRASIEPERKPTMIEPERKPTMIEPERKPTMIEPECIGNPAPLICDTDDEEWDDSWMERALEEEERNNRTR